LGEVVVDRLCRFKLKLDQLILFYNKVVEGSSSRGAISEEGNNICGGLAASLSSGIGSAMIFYFTRPLGERLRSLAISLDDVSETRDTI